MKLLVSLVHRGLVSESAARQAMAAAGATGGIGAALVRQGTCSPEQWQDWQRTEAGTRPVLSRYELRELLGEGGVARVFRAVDKVDGRQVALKVLRPELSKDDTQIERFVREARFLIELEHPHIVKGYRVAREGAQVFFAMEELPGRCLQDVLADEGRLDEETALSIVDEVASALGALHAKGLVHRDVKPGNIIWSEDRGAVLIDLGFAVGRSEAGGGVTTAGTAHYIAPEQAKGSGELDVRADIYALGATLYHLVTGSLPFAGDTSEEILARQVLESLSGERIRALGLSPQVHYFIEKMMQKEREIRFQDPQHLQREVQAFLDQRRAERELEEQAGSARQRLGRAAHERARAGTRRAELAARRRRRHR
jgi:serine/threonine-protein kinase